MSSVLSSKTEGFLLTWTVKNVNIGYHEETIDSPKFMAYNLNNSRWKMSLTPLDTRDCYNFFLQLIEADIENIDVRITITVGTLNGHEYYLNAGEDFSFDFKGDNQCVASISKFYLSEQTLIFYCYIENPYQKVHPYTHCIAHTLIVAEKRCCIWKVRNFARMLPGNPKKYSLFSTVSQSPEIKIIGAFSNQRRFHLEVHVVSLKQISIFGKISVLTPNMDLKWTKWSSFLVTNCMCEMIFKFPLVVNQNSVCEYLNAGALNLLCEFSISTGTIHSEIDESNYLTEEYFDLVQRKQINIEAKCSGINKSTTETIVSQATKDASCSSGSKRTSLTLEEDLRNFYLQKNLCDVTFHIECEMFPAHKSILCSGSPVFKAMFENNMKEAINKKVEIVDIDADTLNRFLLFLYSETLEDLTWDRATKLLYAANKYQVESLKIECTSFLSSKIALANICEVLKLSDLYQDEKLKLACLDFILVNETVIFASKEWETLTLDNPLLSAKTLQNHFSRRKEQCVIF